MTLGVRAHDYGTKPADALVSSIAADGWHTMQLAPRKALAGVQTLADITPACLAQVQHACTQAGVSVGVLGAYVELSLADDAKRGACVADFTANLSFAKALQAGCIASETTPMAAQPGVTRKQALQCLRRSLEAILPAAEALGVRVAIEPVCTHALATPELARALLDDMQSPNLYILFDPVNLLCAEEVPTQRALWERSLEAFGERIAAVHMKSAAVENDMVVPAPQFEQSVVDYEFLWDLLRRLPQAKSQTLALPVLREEANPACAAQDLAFLRGFIND